MLGAQALRTKQKVDQKEREKRHKEKQRNLEIQRERIQRAANDDAQAAMMEYAAAAAAEAAAASTSGEGEVELGDGNGGVSAAELAQRFHQLAMGGTQNLPAGFLTSRGSTGGGATGGMNRKIHQRYSLNANSYHQMPSSARESLSYDRVPQRSPSTDCGNGRAMVEGSGPGGRSSRSGSSGHAITPNASSNRFLRWLGIGASPSIGAMSSAANGKTHHHKHAANNGGAMTGRRDSREISAEKRRMSTY